MTCSKLLYTVALALAPQFCSAQQMDLKTPSKKLTPAVALSSVAPPAISLPGVSPSWVPQLDRWVDLKEMDFSMRYRGVDDSNGAHEFAQGQQRSIIDGKFKFDEQGKYGIVFHASTGRYFNWAYADFAGGGNEKALNLELAKANPNQAGHLAFFAFLFPEELKASQKSGGWSFNVRRLYLDVEPLKGVEAQYGSLDINRGAGSEITTYDNDGYISGERLLIKRPNNIFFDEASVTYAYIGDLYTPNFFARGERLTKSNYHQFLLRRSFAKRVDASFDYTWQAKTNTLRYAAFVKLPESRVFDSVRLEAYRRINTVNFPGLPFPLPVSPGKGFGITASKKIKKRFVLDAGVSSIDYGTGILTEDVYSYDLGLGLNGDSYGVGQHYFVRPAVTLTPYLNAVGFFTQSFGEVGNFNQIIWNKEAFNGGLVFDMKKLLSPKSRVE